jgi:hypothetical protein
VSLQGDLDAIAAMQGKSVPAGNYIEGGDRPWPSYDRIPPTFEPGDTRVAQKFDDDLDEEGFEAPPPSPLIPRPAPAPVVTQTPEAQNLENFRAPDMLIVGNDADKYLASYQGRQVDLSAVEAASVRRVVLTAIKRTIMLQLNEVDALLPKRKRRTTVDLMKRGRPRKVTA